MGHHIQVTSGLVAHRYGHTEADDQKAQEQLARMKLYSESYYFNHV